MKNVLLTCGLFALLQCAAHANIYTFNSGSLNKTVPDANPVGYSTNIAVSGIDAVAGNDTITNVTVTLNISGGYNGDLYGHLVSPDGVLVSLLNRPGKTIANGFGYADAGLSVTLSDTASTNLHNYGGRGGATLTGTFQPDGRNADPVSVLDSTPATTSLGSMNGGHGDGKWTLFLADMSGGAQSTLVSWSISIGVSNSGPGNILSIVTNTDGVVSSAGGTLLASSAGANGTPANGAPLVIGFGYKIKAIPYPGYIFSNWVFSSSVQTYDTNTPLLKFTMEKNTTITANFVTNRFFQSAGTYYGLFRSETGQTNFESAGYFKVKVKAKDFKVGKFSAQVTMDGKKYGAAGTFGLDGVGYLNKPIDRNAKQAGKGELTMRLVLPLDASGTISGKLYNTNTVATNVWTSDLGGYKALDADKLPMAGNNYDGQYTLSVPSPSANIGDGYGILFIEDSKVKLAGGKLADGQNFKTTGLHVGPNGQWPIMSVGDKVDGIYKSMVIGWAQTTNDTVTTPGLRWIKKSGTPFNMYPAGFTNDVTLESSPYSDPGAVLVMPLDGITPIAGGVVYLENGGLSTQLINSVTLEITPTGKNKFRDNNGNVYRLALSMVPKTGKLGGAFKAEGTGVDKGKIAGVVRPDINKGYGYFQKLLPTAGTNTGSFSVEAF